MWVRVWACVCRNPGVCLCVFLFECVHVSVFIDIFLEIYNIKASAVLAHFLKWEPITLLFFFFLVASIYLLTYFLACGNLQGLNPRPLHWKCGILNTGPPGKSVSWPIFHIKEMCTVSLSPRIHRCHGAGLFSSSFFPLEAACAASHFHH